MDGNDQEEFDGDVILDISDRIASLQDLDDEELKLRGMSVEGTLDEVDDPVLIGPDGTPVDTWLGYPY